MHFSSIQMPSLVHFELRSLNPYLSLKFSIAISNSTEGLDVASLGQLNNSKNNSRTNSGWFQSQSQRSARTKPRWISKSDKCHGSWNAHDNGRYSYFRNEIPTADEYDGISLLKLGYNLEDKKTCWSDLSMCPAYTARQRTSVSASLCSTNNHFHMVGNSLPDVFDSSVSQPHHSTFEPCWCIDN